MTDHDPSDGPQWPSVELVQAFFESENDVARLRAENTRLLTLGQGQRVYDLLERYEALTAEHADCLTVTHQQEAELEAAEADNTRLRDAITWALDQKPWPLWHVQIKDALRQALYEGGTTDEPTGDTPNTGQPETVHRCPPKGSGVTPCCGKTPFELPRTDRLTTDETAVSCTGQDAYEEDGEPAWPYEPTGDAPGTGQPEPCPTEPFGDLSDPEPDKPMYPPNLDDLLDEYGNGTGTDT